MDNEQVVFTVCVDKETKEQADEIWKTLGLDMNTSINIFLRQSVRERGIPFEIRLNPTLTIQDFLANQKEDYSQLLGN